MIISRANQASITHVNGDTRIANIAGCVKCSYAEVPPGCRGNAHKHDTLTEVVIVLEGELTVSDALGSVQSEHTQTIRKGDIVVFKPESMHSSSNLSNSTAKVYVLKAIIDTAERFLELTERDWIGEPKT